MAEDITTKNRPTMGDREKQQEQDAKRGYIIVTKDGIKKCPPKS